MDLLDIVQQADRVMTAAALASVRLLVVFTVLPLLGPNILPGTIRGGVMFGLALTVVPLVAAHFPAEEPSVLLLAGLALKEALLGLLLGYLLAIVFWVAGAVGFLIDTQRGASLASALNPASGDASSPLGNLFSQALVAFLFAGGGFLALLSVLYRSYQSWPVFSFIPQLDWVGVGLFLAQFDLLMHLTVLLAAPAVLLMLFAEFALGLVGRFVPQLNIFFVALSIKSMIALFVLALSLTGFFKLLREQLVEHPALFQGLDGLLRAAA